MGKVVIFGGLLVLFFGVVGVYMGIATTYITTPTNGLCRFHCESFNAMHPK